MISAMRTHKFPAMILPIVVCVGVLIAGLFIHIFKSSEAARTAHYKEAAQTAHDKAVSLFRQGKLNDALTYFDRAISFGDYSYLDRATVHNALGRYKAAIADCNQVSSEHVDHWSVHPSGPDAAAAFYTRGVANFGLKKYAEAKENFDDAVEAVEYADGGRSNMSQMIKMAGRPLLADIYYHSAEADQRLWETSHDVWSPSLCQQAQTARTMARKLGYKPGWRLPSEELGHM